MKKRSKKSKAINKTTSRKKPTESHKKIRDLVTRYFILLIAAFPGLAIFYFIFTPLTTYPVYWILDVFYDTLFIYGDVPFILLNDIIPIELVAACIAGSAYYLLLILNLSTPGIKLNKRVKAIVFSFGLFLIANIIRIIILSALAVSESVYFDATHTIFWYGLSTVIVVGIWFAEVKIFRIHKIPIYSDLKFLYKEARK
ncbi:MAG: pacearchaeosortase [Candidatus Pacearchaeota archaeon]